MNDAMNTTALVEMLNEVCTENAIFVSQAYAFFADEMSLPAFKALVHKAWRERKVRLSRCDMPELMGPEHFAASTIKHGVAEFHLVQAAGW